MVQEKVVKKEFSNTFTSILKNGNTETKVINHCNTHTFIFRGYEYKKEFENRKTNKLVCIDHWIEYNMINRKVVNQ
jgi:hypothetical protein